MTTRRSWYLVTAIVVGIVFPLCLSWSLDSRQRSRTNLDRLLATLAWNARPTVAGLAEADLSILDNYPEVKGFEILSGDGKVLQHLKRGEYQEGDWMDSRDVANSDGSVRLWASLPRWVPLTTGLPLASAVLILLNLGLATLRSRSKTAPSTAAATETRSVSRGRTLVLELDQDLTIQATGAAASQFGYKPDDLLGRHVDDLVGAFVAKGDPTEGSVTDAQGRRVDSTIVSSSILDEQGRLDRVVVTLTEESVSIEELKDRFQQLRRSYQVLCENAAEHFFVLSQSLKVIYGNRSFAELLDRSGEEIVASEFLDLLPPRQKLLVADTVHDVLHSRVSRELTINLDLDGERRTLDGSFHFLDYEQESGTVMGVFRDVTEKLRVEEELRVSKERTIQAQRVEALGRLAGGVAHDFNNLLACMVINLEILEGAIDDPDDSECLADIRSAADKACSLVNQLLLYSRKKCSQVTDVCCHQTIGEVIKLTRPILRNQVKLTTHLQARYSVVSLEPGQLDQIVMNLIVNARDALPEGGKVEIRTRDVLDGQIEISVKDDGIGISKELQAKIFEPYFTTKGIGEGTGLGLATVSAVVEKAGGSLTLESEPGRGAEFIIRLPAKPGFGGDGSLPRDLELPAAPPRAGRSPSDFGKRRILLVEDTQGVQKLVSRVLRREGYSVTAAHDGDQAKKLLEAEDDFDLLVTDLNLPGMSGIEVAKLFTREDLRRPVLLMSGYPGTTLDEDFQFKNFAFVGKPFALDDLATAIASLNSREVPTS